MGTRGFEPPIYRYLLLLDNGALGGPAMDQPKPVALSVLCYVPVMNERMRMNKGHVSCAKVQRYVPVNDE